MDFDELRKIMKNIDRRGPNSYEFTMASTSFSDKSVFNTSRLKFVVDYNNEIDKIAIYGLQPIRVSENRGMGQFALSDIAIKNGIGYSDVSSFFKGEDEVDGFVRYYSFAAEPQVEIEGDIENCARSIYDAQDDLIRLLSGGGMAKHAEERMEEERVKKKQKKAALKVQKRKERGWVYNHILWSVDGRRMTVANRLYELGNERLIYGDVSWNRITSQLEKESGLEFRTINLQQKFCRMEKEFGDFVGPVIPAMDHCDYNVGRSDVYYKKIIQDGNESMSVEQFIYKKWVSERISERARGDGGMTFQDLSDLVNKKAGLHLNSDNVKQRVYKYKKELKAKELV